MMLTPCSSCRRYIRESETACPFCSGPVGRRAGSVVAAGAVAMMLTACQGQQPEPAEPNAPQDAPTTEVPTIEPTPEAPETDPAATLPTSPTAEPTAEPEQPEPEPANSVADNKPPAPAPVTMPTGPQRPVVMRYGIAPRLPPKPAPPAPKK